MYYSQKRILVTGGAGFLGSHLCDRLVSEGNDVLCLDNFYTGSKQNIRHLLGKPNFELIRHDLVHPIFLEVDEIYNLACPAAPVHYQYNPVKTAKTNVMGAIHMLGLAKRVRAKILQASSSEIYGNPTEHPQKENYWGNVNSIGPRSCYDEGKRCAETLFSITTGKTGSISAWFVFLIPMGQECIPMTVELSAILSFRHLPVKTLRFLGMETKPAPFAI